MQITGMKINSPPPSKKPTVTNTNQSSKVQSKKPTVVRNTVKKQTVQKVPPKKEQQKTKIEEVKEKPKQEPVQEKKEQVKVQVQQVKEEEKSEPVIEPFQVLLRYNHYKEKFPTQNGILSFAPVDEKYCFNLVYKGNYLPVLKIYGAKEEIVPETTGTAVQYSWKVQQNQVYGISITQDDEEEAKRERVVYKAPQKQVIKKNNRFDELTNEMKQMDTKELGGDKHREMLEQRDLQDILYS